VSFPAFRQDIRFYADPIVTYAQSKVVRVVQYDLQFAGRGMLAGIADRFVSDPIDFIAGDRVHVPLVTRHRKLTAIGLSMKHSSVALRRHAARSFVSSVEVRRELSAALPSCVACPNQPDSCSIVRRIYAESFVCDKA
jgi:hypothetical protein